MLLVRLSPSGADPQVLKAFWGLKPLDFKPAGDSGVSCTLVNAKHSRFMEVRAS